MIKTWDRGYTRAVIDLWNEVAVKDGYKELNEETFESLFQSNRYFDPENTFVLLESNQVKGFACGCTGDDLPLGDAAGYMTCIVLTEQYQTDEYYKLMLESIENRFRQLGKTQSDVLFFNPMMLPWYIPDTPKHEHNNAPGVPIDSSLYEFLIREGYKERAREHAMYLNLSAYITPEQMKAKEKSAADRGYHVELYDPVMHHGVAEMLERLGNPLWQKEIGESTEKGIPVVVAALHGKAVGFAGPVIRQDNGRGYFAGIGVHPDHEGHGLGSILFFKLCEAFKEIGTDYMSLYTGSSNPAIRIYERAGFHTVRQFSVMRRELSR